MSEIVDNKKKKFEVTDKDFGWDYINQCPKEQNWKYVIDEFGTSEVKDKKEDEQYSK